MKTSFSQITTFLNCPYKGYQNYIQKNRPFGGSVFTVFGTAMHETIQEYLSVMYTESIVATTKINWEDKLHAYICNAYAVNKEQNGGINFLDSRDLLDIYEDGVEILKYFIKKRDKYFKKTGWELLGIEVPLEYEIKKNVTFIGYIDVLLKEKATGKIIIIDLKTSFYGWKDKQKKDIIKRLQLQLYKKFYSEQFNVPYSDIEVQFIILKRKIPSHLLKQSDFPIHRMQRISVPSSERTIKKLYKEIVEDQYINLYIDETGNYKKDKDLYSIAKYATACTYCPFYWKHSNVLNEDTTRICSKWTNKYLQKESN